MPRKIAPFRSVQARYRHSDNGHWPVVGREIAALTGLGSWMIVWLMAMRLLAY
jgi:hypothetical protein